TWYTDSPNGLTDGDKNNDTLRTEFYNQLAGGTYTVGGVNPDFATPAAAVAALASGIGGAVVFDIRPGTYTGQLVINGPITGLNATNTITFKGQNKATTIITGSSTSAMFLLNQVSYITIRDLTVTNTSTSTPVGIGVIGNSSSNVGVGTKIINCNVNVPIIVSGTSSTGYGISFTATASGHGASTTRMDSILVDSCTITGGGYGLVAYGASNSSYNRNLIFRNNTINNCNYQGAYIAYNYNAVVFDNNTIHMQGFNYGYYGLYFYYNQNSDANNEHIITRNRIDGFGGYGVYLYYTNGSALAKPTLFANNIVIGNSPSSSYPGVYGVYLYNPSTYLANAYHNTIVMSGAGSAPSYACFLNAGSSITNIKNNIFWVTNGSYTPFYTSTSLSGNSLNYNLYYNATNTSTGNLVYRDAVYYTPLNYLSATAGGDSSFNLLPPLDNAYKLTNGCQRGVTTNGLVNQDIEGNSRLLAEPNLGAYEYQGVSLDLQVSSMPYPATPITLGAQDLSVIVRNNGTSTITSFNIAYTLNNGTPVVMPWSGSLPACDVDTIIFTGTNQITLGNSANAIKVYTYSPNSSVDLNLANDTLLTVLSPPLNGTYVIGNAPSDFVNFSAATSALQIRGVSGPVVFNVKTGVYNEQVLVGSTIGTSPTNTVTFKSLANHVDSVEINNTGNYVVKLNNGANYIVFDKLTISQTNPTVQGAAIFVSSMCNYDTIRNCKVNAAIYNVNGVTATHYLLQANPYIGTGLALINNRFNGGYYGPYVFGTSRTTPHRFTYIVNNTFDNIYFYQMYQYYSVGMKFMNNTFTPQTVGGTTTNYAYCYYADSGFQFVNNNWNGNNYTSVYFYMYYSSSKFNERSLIANNRIFAAPNAYFYVGQTGTEYQDIVHNTFFTGTGYFYVGANVTGNFRIMNNVFSGSGSYAYYFSTTPNASLMQSDYNLVHSTGSSTPYFLSSARTLTEFRSLYSGFERNSLSYTASFTSVSNPAPLASDPSVWAINGRGTHLNVASADANNVTRPATPAQGVPDLGAFEVTPTSTPPLAVASPAAPVQGGTQLFT
ncbi:MAG: right-handed parallel beta-helix repeat-containing protein, partial [Chitinophagaceae bacterium]|nr:right-handed parallel beta-helix repeat-containing protein [Chitinophagaceae bacterium]